MANSAGEIYSATYSNVPVYELKVAGDHIMRRRSDDWVNATHILKIAGFDKPARTRILERDVQKGVHEKIQGGYGKYQGTWVPLTEGRLLAERNGVLDKIAKIFDFVPGDRSPPPAPKHTTAASGRPKPAKAAAPRRATTNSYYAPADEVQFEEDNTQYHNENDPGRATPETASLFDEDFLPASQTSNVSRKRKREAEDAFKAGDVSHTMYGDELLDYFVTAGDDPSSAHIFPPIPPVNFDANRPIDNNGNNALHWACAMGDISVAKDLMARGASATAENTLSGETPLMRAVLFTNNYDKQVFGKLVDLLAGSIIERDRHGATVFHHIAETSRSKSKWACARYYCEVLINKMSEMGYSFVRAVLSSTDTNGDTAVLCAVRNGCIKVATFLLNHCPEAGDVSNMRGESANDVLMMIRDKRNTLEQPPSSPPRPADSFGFTASIRKRSRQDRKDQARQPTSRAASHVMSKVGPLMESASTKLADLYDTEIKEKDAAIAEAKAALSEFENQRHRVRQETFALMARGEAEGFNNISGTDDLNGDMLGIPTTTSTDGTPALRALRQEYDQLLAEQESLLEQLEHITLHQAILTQDRNTPVQAFRSANNDRPLTLDEARAALPYALALDQEQTRRIRLVKELARLSGEAGTSEKVGKCRKLVAIATGLKEEELDGMSKELLESLEATKMSPLVGSGSVGVGGVNAGSSVTGPRTPPRVVGGVVG